MPAVSDKEGKVNQPTVCAVMLTRDRPELAQRAVECFGVQTYANKRLIVLDTGDESCGYLGDYDGVTHHWADLSLQSWSIGKLRNNANTRSGESDIIIHWDDDDWSHPNRIDEQVELLQSSGVDCVGYREALFWREGASAGVHTIPGEAWLYSNGEKRTCLGTSLCYWRKVWEARPFSEMNGPNPRMRGEDKEFCRDLKCMGYSTFGAPIEVPLSIVPPEHDGYSPRMICRIHAGNAHQYPLDEWRNTSPHWKRVPDWDTKVQEILK